MQFFLDIKKDVYKNYYRYFNIYDNSIIKDSTFSDYLALMDAYQDIIEDRRYEVHTEAWLNQVVQNVDSNGKPQFKRFDDFYKPLSELKEKEETSILARVKELRRIKREEPERWQEIQLKHSQQN